MEIKKYLKENKILKKSQNITEYCEENYKINVIENIHNSKIRTILISGDLQSEFLLDYVLSHHKNLNNKKSIIKLKIDEISNIEFIDILYKNNFFITAKRSYNGLLLEKI